MNEATTLATTTTTTASPFREEHERGKHTLLWHFPQPCPDDDPVWDMQGYARADQRNCAICNTALVTTLEKALVSINVFIEVGFGSVCLSITAKSKDQFAVASAISRLTLKDVDPAAFTAEVEAVLRAEAAGGIARKRASYLLDVAQSAKQQVCRTATERTDERLASEIDALKQQYAILAEKYREECEKEAAKIVADLGEFSDLGDDAEIVQRLTRESIERKPLRFVGPTIHSATLFGAGVVGADPGYKAALDALTARLLGRE